MHISPLVAVCVIIFIVYFGQSMVVPIIPVFAESMGASPGEVGIIILSHMASAAVLSVPVGALSYSWGRRRIAIMGAMLAGLALILLSQASSSNWILLFYALAGIGHAAYGPALIATVGDVTVSGSMAQAYGWSQASRQTAFSVGPAAGGFLSDALNFRVAFFVAAVFMIAAVLFGVFRLPKGGGSSRKVKEEGSRKGFSEIFENSVAIATLLAVFCAFFTNSVFFSFLPIYATKLGISTASIGLVFTIQAVFNALSRFPAALYADKTGKRAPLIVYAMLANAAMVASLTSTSSLIVLMLLAAMLGLSAGTSGVLNMIMLAEVSSVESRGLAMGLYTTCLYAGMGVGPAIIGQVITIYGFDAGFKLVVVAAILGAAILYSVARNRKLL